MNPQPTCRHSLPSWAPQAVAESAMHAPQRNASSSHPHAPAALSVPIAGPPTDASYPPTGVFHQWGARVAATRGPLTASPRQPRALQHACLGSQTDLSNHQRRSAVSMVPKVASGIFSDDISAHGHVYAQQALARQTPTALLPRGHSLPFLGATVPAAHGRVNTDVEVPASGALSLIHISEPTRPY